MKKIYVLLTKTGTVPSKIIGKLSRARFSHASLSIDNEFTDMFSFGRKGMKVFPGGFAKENLRTRVLKKYENCPCEVISMEVTDENYENIKNKARYFSDNKDLFGYSYIGIFACWCRIKLKFKNRYFCSQCVSEILKAGNVQLPYDPLLMRPMDFMKIKDIKKEYLGTIKDLAYLIDNKLIEL